jgi:hypothetical protein
LNKIDWTYVSALFSVAFGWCLNELSQWFRTRKDDRKIKKQILFNLLETNFILNQLNTSELVQIVTEKVFGKIPEEERTEEFKEYLFKLYTTMLNETTYKNVAENLTNIEEKYSNAVDNLASIDPITAYRLNGKTKILQVFELMMSYYNQIPFPKNEIQIEDQIKSQIEAMKPEMIKEAISELEEEIIDIAFSIDLWTWWKTKSTLKRIKIRIKGEFEDKIDEIFDSMFNNLMQTLQSQ